MSCTLLTARHPSKWLLLSYLYSIFRCQRLPSLSPFPGSLPRLVPEKVPRAAGAKIAYCRPPSVGWSPVERKSGYFLEISPPQTQHNAHPVSLNQMYIADRHSTVLGAWDGMNPSFRPFAKQALRTTQVCARALIALQNTTSRITPKFSTPIPNSSNYRAPGKCLYGVARNFFLLLLNCSVWVLLSKKYILFQGAL